jgi:ferredoxin-NADP reductase
VYKEAEAAMADTLKLIKKTHLADNVWTFKFEAHPAFGWTAGQYIQVELPHANPDQEGTKRFFTVSAAPYEGHPAITTRITESSFKQALVNLPEDGVLKLQAKPTGDFTWTDSSSQLVFVAAGIGITPYHSILTQRAHDRAPLNVALAYANRTDAIPFKDEFDAIAATEPKLKISYVTGLVTAGRIAELVPDLHKKLVYVSGPEPMVEVLGDQLKSAGLPESQLKQDFFPNYTEAQF